MIMEYTRNIILTDEEIKRLLSTGKTSVCGINAEEIEISLENERTKDMDDFEVVMNQENQIEKLSQINAQLMEATKQYLEAILDNYELDPSGEIEDKLKDLINKAEGGNK